MTAEFDDVPIGRRVVVRYRLPAGYPQQFTDVIGELLALSPPTVRTAEGETVAIAADQVVALKAVGARPIRTSEIRALESAATDGWPGLEREWLNGWSLHAGNSYTGRANSAVPLGSPGVPAILDIETLQWIGKWYIEHDLPLRLRLPDRLAPTPPDWISWGDTVVLGLDIANFVLPQGPSMVRFESEPSPPWLELHRYRGDDTAPGPPPIPDPAVLCAIHNGEVGFAGLGLPAPLAIGRAAVTTAPGDRRWVGLSCVAVAAPHRRHGLGTLMCAELIRWGHRRGATHAYLQVEATNSVALAMYRDMGFVEHHHYHYAAPPQQ